MFGKTTIEIGLSMATLLGMLGTSLPTHASIVREVRLPLGVALLPPLPDNHLAQVSEIAEFQRVAQAENATLVQYSLLEDAGGNSILMWVIPAEGEIEFRQIDLATRSLSQLVTDARQQIQGGSPVRNSKGAIEVSPNPDSPPKNSNSFPALQELYRILIEPIAEFLPQDPGSLVVFIPQGDLFLVPFAALQDEAGTYLVDRYAIATAPSIEVLDLLHQRRQTITGRATDILIVGNPTPPVVATAPDAEPQPLSPLPGAELEAIAIAQLFSTEALTGDRATKAAILDRMSSARILHFATYNSSIWTGELPGAIVLASTDAEPSLLTPDDIQALTLNAELAILSFDDTALGQITGDGVIGLPRAFMAAGVPTVIAALWSVNDNSAADLMLEFYRQLPQNPNPAQALRQATIAIREKYPSPKDWAVFTVTGTSGVGSY